MPKHALDLNKYEYKPVITTLLKTYAKPSHSLQFPLKLWDTCVLFLTVSKFLYTSCCAFDILIA